RALGQHVATQVFGEAAGPWTAATPGPAGQRAAARGVFARLKQRWLPPLDCAAVEWLKASELALNLDQHLGGQAALTAAAHATYPELNGGRPPWTPTRWPRPPPSWPA